MLFQFDGKSPIIGKNTVAVQAVKNQAFKGFNLQGFQSHAFYVCPIFQVSKARSRERIHPLMLPTMMPFSVPGNGQTSILTQGDTIFSIRPNN